MRFSTIAFTLFGAAASASASSLFGRQALPDCAVTCTASADLGGCVVSDTHCLCTNAAFVSSTTACIEKTCTSAADLAAALSFSQGLCLKVGVTLAAPSSTAPPTSSSTPTAPTSSSSSSAGSSTAAAAPAATNKPSSASAHGASTLFGLAAAGLVAFTL